MLLPSSLRTIHQDEIELTPITSPISLSQYQNTLTDSGESSDGFRKKLSKEGMAGMYIFGYLLNCLLLNCLTTVMAFEIF